MATLKEIRQRLAGFNVEIHAPYVDQPARVSGDTYPAAAVLRSLGGRFDRRTQTWRVPVQREGFDLDYEMGY